MEETMMASDQFKIQNQRLIYENNTFLVEHRFMAFADWQQRGSFSGRNDQLARVETGATPIT